MKKTQSGTQRNIRFDDETAAILDKWKPVYGTYSAVVFAAMKALDGKEAPTDEELLALIKARLEQE